MNHARGQHPDTYETQKTAYKRGGGAAPHPADYFDALTETARGETA